MNCNVYTFEMKWKREETRVIATQSASFPVKYKKKNALNSQVIHKRIVECMIMK